MSNDCPFCGSPSSVHKTKRSLPQIRRYHKMVSLAFDNWPESHPHQFANAEECRAYVQMKAGWREIGAQIPLTGMSKERAMMLAEAAIRGAGSYAMPIIHGDVLVIFKPKSVSFAKMSHLDFCKLNDAVEDVIRDIIGVEPEQLLKERERAA